MKEKEIDYIQWIDNLTDEVMKLMYSKKIIEYIEELFIQNPKLGKAGELFWYYAHYNFNSNILVQIARLVDAKKFDDDYSLLVFLNSIKKEKYISYQNYLSVFKNNEANFPDELAKIKFENLTGQSINDKCFNNKIDNAIKKLSDIQKKVKILRHKRIAHLTNYDLTKPENYIPTYQDIDEFIVAIKHIVDYCSILIANKEYVYDVQINFDEIFNPALMENKAINKEIT